MFCISDSCVTASLLKVTEYGTTNTHGIVFGMLIIKTQIWEAWVGVEDNIEMVFSVAFGGRWAGQSQDRRVWGLYMNKVEISGCKSTASEHNS